VVKNLLYRMLKGLVGIFFNILNLLLAGNLPPFGCVSIVIRDQDQASYLVIERPEGGFVFPGGFMRWGEHSVQTAQRECMEETGLKLNVKELIGCSSTTSSRFTRMSTLTVIYYAEVVAGELKNSIEGQSAWHNEAELLEGLQVQQRGILEHFLQYYEQSSHSKRFHFEN